MKCRCAFFLMTLVILAVSSTSNSATVEWSVASTFSLKDKPRDTAMSLNGKWIYILTQKGEILIYDSNGTLKDTILVGEDVESIKVGPRDDVLLLTNGKEKRVQVITLDYIQVIDISGSPFKGKTESPVAVVNFTDFQ